MTAQHIRRLAGARVGVPDPAATAAFLADGLGFACAEGDGVVRVICAGDYGSRGQVAIELVEHPGLELLRARFALGSGTLEELEAVLAAAGVEHDRDAGGLHFSDPAGNRLSVEPGDAALTDLPPANPLRPRRLGHVNMKAPAPPVAAAFYREILGMRLSEQIGEALFFLRLGSEHHSVGLRPGGRGELHHLAFEVAGWHVYQPILDRLAALELQVEYGPGRHAPGNSIFTYVCDPSSGLRIELFAEMGRIADDASYEPVRWEAGARLTKTLNLWGPQPPESFLA